MELQRSPDPRS